MGFASSVRAEIDRIVAEVGTGLRRWIKSLYCNYFVLVAQVDRAAAS